MKKKTVQKVLLQIFCILLCASVNQTGTLYLLQKWENVCFTNLLVVLYNKLINIHRIVAMVTTLNVPVKATLY